jgi:hypothetical protein
MYQRLRCCCVVVVVVFLKGSDAINSGEVNGRRSAMGEPRPFLPGAKCLVSKEIFPSSFFLLPCGTTAAQLKGETLALLKK